MGERSASITKLRDGLEEKSITMLKYKAVLKWMDSKQINTLEDLDCKLRREDFFCELGEVYKGEIGEECPIELCKELKNELIRLVAHLKKDREGRKKAQQAPLYKFKFPSSNTDLAAKLDEISESADQNLFRELLVLVNPFLVVSNKLSLLGDFKIAKVKAKLGSESESIPGQNGVRDLLGGRTMLNSQAMTRLIDLLDFWDEVVRYNSDVVEFLDYKDESQKDESQKDESEKDESKDSYQKNYTFYSNLSKREEMVKKQLGAIVNYLTSENIYDVPNIWGMSCKNDMERLKRVHEPRTATIEKASVKVFVKSLALFLTDNDFDKDGKLVTKCRIPILKEDGSIVFEEQHPLYRFSSEAVKRRRLVRAKLSAK